MKKALIMVTVIIALSVYGRGWGAEKQSVSISYAIPGSTGYVTSQSSNTAQPYNITTQYGGKSDSHSLALTEQSVQPKSITLPWLPLLLLGTRYFDEGSSGSPLDITGLLPYAGQVSANGYSYYRITGVTPNAIYTIILTRTAGLPYQNVPNAGGSGSNACGWVDTTPNAVIECAMRATPAGELEFYVKGDGTVGGAFAITYTAGGVVNEGNSNDPVVVNVFPFSGGALVQSYYLLTGLTPNSTYAIQFTNGSGPVALLIFQDATYQEIICSTLNDSGNSCNVTANGSGEIYLITSTQQNQYGVTYTISVTAAGVANEGSSNEPVDITGQLPYSGMVHLLSSWYIITGLTPSNPYTITLANATDAANLYVYGPGWWLLPISQKDSYFLWNNGDGTSIESVSVADSNGDIRIEVRGGDSVDGATFELDIAAGGMPNEGYFGAPVNVTGNTPWSGTIYNGPSYYVITGLASATDYTITLGDQTVPLDLSVYADEGYQNLLCNSNQLGTSTETCNVQTTTGELHIRVTGATIITGGTFTLDIAP